MNKLIFKLFYADAVFLLLLVTTIFIFGCANGITGNAAAIPSETAKNPEIYFCPKDDCSSVLADRISLANFSVYCALYDIDLKNVISALAQKSKTADVKIVIDNENQEGQIKGGGIRMDDGNQLMHNKFCAIDGKIVITGSFNPTYNDNSRNNNNAVVVYSAWLANNYEEEFKELWSGQFGKGNNVRHPVLQVNGVKMENYFCPEDKCAFHVINLIRNAKSSVYFMSFSFTNKEIADALVKKGDLDVRGIFDASQSASEFSQLKRLQSFGLNVKKDTNKYKMHHKVFIIDNETVATGSFNPTLSADTKNDENLLILHDKKIAGAFLKEFDDLWQ